MTDKPILFSGPMVRAILDGRKSMTRRVLEPQPDLRGNVSWGTILPGQRCVAYQTCIEAGKLRLPYAPGDRLWVRETLSGRQYAADFAPVATAHAPETWTLHKPSTPSIHMPRWASRLTLTVTDVRVQRVQEISGADTIAEGVQCDTCEAMKSSQCHGKGCFDSRIVFHDLWDSLNAKRGFGWDENPWVCAITFTAEQRNIDA